MLTVGIVGIAFEAKRRDWLGLATWACAIAAGAVRLAPVPEQISEPVYIGLAVLFGVLCITRVVRMRHN
jgi:phosphatidylserine synthase